MCRPYWLWQHADPQQNALTTQGRQYASLTFVSWDKIRSPHTIDVAERSAAKNATMAVPSCKYFFSGGKEEEEEDYKLWPANKSERERERERERLQCFSQPASLITYRRRQRSNVENIKTVQNELENLHMILLCKKGSHGVCVRGKQRSIPLPLTARGRASATLPNVIHLCQTKCQ